MSARQPLQPPLRLLSDPLPVGEVTELEPLAVIERDDKRAWALWDACTELQDFDPAPEVA